MSAQKEDQQDKIEQVEVNAFFGEGVSRILPKVMQLVERRIGWAAVIGVVTTLTLWWLGEIDGLPSAAPGGARNHSGETEENADKK